MVGNLNTRDTSNRENAAAAWSPDLPDWIGLLADACDRTNQRIVAEKLGKSSGYVSRILNRKYAGNYGEAEIQVRAVFGEARVMCPLPIGGSMALTTCITNRRRKRAREWHHVQFARACPACPNNTDREEEE